MTKKLTAEGLGTGFLLASCWLPVGFLLATVVGSSIMAVNLAQGNETLALLANTLVTGATLVVIILVFSGLSEAHFNPAVTLARSLTHKFNGVSPAGAPVFITAQLAGAVSASVIMTILLSNKR